MALANNHNPFDDEEPATADSGFHEDDEAAAGTWNCDTKLDDDDLEAGGGDNAPLLAPSGSSQTPGHTGSEPAAARAAPQPAGAKPLPPQQQHMCACLTVSYYRKYFNVDTRDVLQRTLSGILPRTTGTLLEVIGDNADMYGPFWICTTLIFVISVCGNLASWLHWDKATTWVYDFRLVTSAVAMIYGYAGGAPLATWAAFQFVGVPVPLIKLLCLYGYVLTPFIPAAILSLASVIGLDWAAPAAACLLSAVVVAVNLRPHVEPFLKDPVMQGVLAVMALAHLIFALLLKLYFFASA